MEDSKTCPVCGAVFFRRADDTNSLWGKRLNCSRRCASYRGPVVNRLWSKVDKAHPAPSHMPHLGECWVWTGNRDRRGYGQMGIGPRRKVMTHRLSFAIAFGEQAERDAEVVAHKCDNPACVRPEHLFAATQAENLSDMAAKDRSTHGENNPMHKLTAESVLQIRSMASDGVNVKEIAMKFGIHRWTVRKVIRRESWKRVA